MTSNAARPAPFTPIRGFRAIGSIRQAAWRALSAARGESLAAFDERCIPAPPQRGCRVGDPGAGGVAPPSNTPGILSRRALPAGRLARLGATPDFHHGLLSAHTTLTETKVRALRFSVTGDVGLPLLTPPLSITGEYGAI